MSGKNFTLGDNVEHFTIADVARDNPDFRKVLWTGEHAQIVVMTIPSGGQIGDEVHEHTDQILTFVSGTGEADLNGHTHPIDAGDQCAVPAGARHNFRNTGEEPLVLYTIYSPPQHAAGAAFATREEADAAEAAGEDEPPPALTLIVPANRTGDQDTTQKEIPVMSKVYVFTDYGGPETQQLIDRPVPEPGDGELAIQVRAAGVNPADWKIREGRLGRALSLPAPMGLEAAGVITAVGDGVEGFAVGDEVLGLVASGQGGLAEHTLLSASTTVAKPEEISFTDAATIPVAAATAYDATHQIELQPGQTLLLLGAGGGVGLMAAQIGRVHEFTVVGVASAAKRELVESTGAIFIESGPGVVERVREVAPDGVDLIVDLVGGEALRAVADLTPDRARIISAADPETAVELGGQALARTSEAMGKITEVIQYGLVDPHADAQFDLNEAGRAIAAVETGHAAGKVVVVPEG